MRYLTIALHPFVLLWDTLFGARSAVVDMRQIVSAPTRVLPAPVGAVVCTRAWLYRAPVSRVRREGPPVSCDSKKKVHVLGGIDRNERAVGEVVEEKAFEVVQDRQEIVPGVWTKPKDVLEIRKSIEG